MKLRTIPFCIALLVIFASFSNDSFAWGRGGGGWGRGGGWGGGGGYGGGGYGGGGYGGGGYGRRGCSPETQTNIVKSVETTLIEISKDQSFENAVQFKEFVTATSAIQDAEKKLEAYFAVVGVDSRDADALLQFFGARDNERDVYIEKAQKAMGLTEVQATELVDKVTSSVLSAMGSAN